MDRIPIWEIRKQYWHLLYNIYSKQRNVYSFPPNHMKKSLIILSSCVPFLLAWCSFTQTPQDVTVDTGLVQTGVTAEVTGVVVETTGTTFNSISSWTQAIDATETSMVQPWLQLTTESSIIKNYEGLPQYVHDAHKSQISGCSHVDPNSNYMELTDYNCKEMRGYDHIYYAPALGIKISYNMGSIDPIDLKGFWEKDPKILALDGNKLYSIDNPKVFIIKLPKDPTETPEEIMQSKPAPKGCIYMSGIIFKDTTPVIAYYFSNNISNQDPSVLCRNEEDQTTTNYFFDTKNKDYYYQKNGGEACAPGACDALDIAPELFLK